jgi:hypothetical protein
VASTVEGRRLTERHRQAQVRLSALTVARIRQLFALLDPADLGRNTPGFVDAAVLLIAQQHDVSVGLARRYYRAFRAAETGSQIGGTLPAPGFDRDRVRTSVLVTGPVKVKQGMALGKTFEQASRTALTTVSGAATRHVLNGGRNMLSGAIQADRAALGYARATSGKPCAFCALLAARGPVYKSDTSASFKPHDACHCEPEPVFRRGAPFPGQRFADLYADTAKGTSDPLNSFRRAYESG